ncbi:dihydroxyacetone kinase family protein [Erwinia piriflorinigrans]|uniref:Dihydroxyacetone kinase n=1 Tax=Erwinia piriflorinigrans CFBP 5888 TaxID=1161919 RepID=V5Z444_9GAMM|nr:dihydroxyacetone kinase family protein [Erwinia piriflorinigrans]CCG86080.1 dihydroxyacetone kinase [Erwinia piriflorinigrans CFBP 5888]
MTWIFNESSEFAQEMVSGFVNVHSALVRQVSGGVVRNTKSKPGSVAVIIGGGSGHYPAFAGLVGQGLAHGAVLGNVFASPSAQQIYSVARAANNGGGVLLAFGNYAGDVLHFGRACERLRSEGIPCETIAITDDISSATPDEMSRRRGVAGDLVVFKIAAAAAERGDSLADVLAVAHAANQQTRTLGVAFSGCTLPGAKQPLFSVPAGMMALGMGMHGEPGISEIPLPSAKNLANMLVESLLTELPEGVMQPRGARIGVIVNGLGSVKYEELFVLWHNVQQCLVPKGVKIADVQVGEFVTSFNMAGISLTFIWFNDESLEKLWLAPANSPAFCRSSVLSYQPLTDFHQSAVTERSVPRGSPASRQTANCIVAIINALTKTLIDNAEELGRIDAVAGDGDHGMTMKRGAIAAQRAALNALQQHAGAGSMLQIVGDAWANDAGGTSGAIWGVILNTIGSALGNTDKPDAAGISNAIVQSCHEVMHFGKARPGDKTLVDVLLPFSQALVENVNRKMPLAKAWKAAAEVARQSAQQTAQLLPRIGRARPLAERSIGSPDAGAISLALMVETVSTYLSECAALEE